MIWLTFVYFEVGRNFFLIEGLELRPSYGWSKIIRFLAGVGYLLARYPDPATTAFPAIVYALFQISSFYLLFDLSLNLMRNKPWDYQGANSGTLDKLSKRKYYLLKAGTLVILVLSLIVMYAN